MFSAEVLEKRTDIKTIDVLSLNDPQSRKRAIHQLGEGRVVAAQMRNVFGFWINAANPNARGELARIKNESLVEGKPIKKLSTMLPGEVIIPFVDQNQIATNLKPYTAHPTIYSQTFGSICHTVLPLYPEAAEMLPGTILSKADDNSGTNLIYNLDPTGHPDMNAFINELYREGIVTAVTSMNDVGSPEITDVETATKFLEGLNMPITLLGDEYPCRPEILGSFPQVDFRTGTVVRDGHIPHDLLTVLYGLEPSNGNMKLARYEVNFPFQYPLLVSEITPADSRLKLLEFIHYQNPSEE
jgi:hypothetical protein